ncbi:MAG: RNA polymerase sigma factor [Bacteroidia bacterium]|nr:RNA polymerase sigma factor [Bacteroidia bacterium]
MTINPPLNIHLADVQSADSQRDVLELVKRCMNKDRVAQEKLYKRYHGKLMALCLRYFSNRDDALAALNQGFLKVFKNLKSYNSEYDFGGWVYRIVQRTAIDLVRAQVRYERRIPTEEPDASLGISPEAVKKLYAKDLLQLLHKLPATTRIVFNLFALEGYSHAEIADELGMSAGTSKWHVNNARKLLKQWIDKQ